MHADQAAALFLSSLPPGARILDIGSGKTTAPFPTLARGRGFDVTTLDWSRGDDWENMGLVHLGQYDGVWMSHTLEHLLDVHKSLVRVRIVCKPGGVVAITVPPLKHEIVGGHVSLWNAGLLLYRLVLAGFDCSQAAVKTYGYNCSVVVRKQEILDMPKLTRDYGDIDRLARYFPFAAKQGFDGQIRELNWRPV